MTKNSPVWTWPDIKCQLEKRGILLVDIAKEAGVSRVAVTNVKHKASANIQARIARKLGIPPQLIWPTRYAQDGMPNRRGSQSHRRRRAA